MKFLIEFNDDSVVIDDILEVSKTARAFVVDEFKNIALLHYAGEYKGNKFSFYTTPGGAIEGYETPEMAVKREVMEEIGYGCNILYEVGTIVDYYVDMARQVITNYFIVEPTEKKQINWTEREQQNIKDIKWVDFGAAELILADMPTDAIGQGIQRRDLHALMEVKKLLKL